MEICPSATVHGRHVAEDDVRVGHRRLDPSAPVAGRARIGARAARTDLESACRIEPGDAAASCADLGDVDRRDPQQLACAADQPASGRHRAADLVLAAARDGAVLDQRRLRGRAAHVEGEQVVDAELLAHPAGGDDTGCGTRLEREDRPLLRVVRGHHAAGGLHDLERPIDPDPVEAGPNPVDVRGHQRPHVGVDDRGRGALVLALLAQDLARERDVRLRQLLGQDRAEALLVLGVEVGVQEADRHRLDARRTQAGGERAALLLVDRPDDVAVRGNALVQLEAEMPFDERWWLAPEEVVHVRDPQPAELEHVAEAGSRDERGRGCLAARGRRSSPPSSRARPPRPARRPDRRLPRRRRGRSSGASRAACGSRRGHPRRAGSRR